MAASAKFLEEALNTDVDESAVNAIVGSLETQLVTSATTQVTLAPSLQQAPGLTTAPQQVNHQGSNGSSTTVVAPVTTTTQSPSQVPVAAAAAPPPPPPAPAPATAAIVVDQTVQKHQQQQQLVTNGTNDNGSSNNNNSASPNANCNSTTSNTQMVNSMTAAAASPSPTSTPSVQVPMTSVNVIVTGTASTQPLSQPQSQPQPQPQPQPQQQPPPLQLQSSHTVQSVMQQQSAPQNQPQQQQSSFINQVPSNQVTSNQTNQQITALAKVQGEHVKIVYPGSGQVIATAGVVNANNKLTFPNQSNVAQLANGTLGVVTTTTQALLQSTTNVISNVSGGAQTNNQASGQINVNKPAALVIKTSGAPGGMVSVPMSSVPVTVAAANITNTAQPQQQQQQGKTPAGVSSPAIVPSNVQILNVNAMRPGTPVTSQQQAKQVASRVVIGQTMVGGRAGAPGITLQTLQGLQGTQGGHLLLKTENGQYQLLRVAPTPGAATGTVSANSIAGNTVVATQGAGGTTYRLAALPAVSRLNAQFTGPPLATIRKPVQTVAPTVTTTTVTPVTSTIVAATTPSPTPTTTAAQTSPAPAPVKRATDNTKEKCRKFLANLLELSSREPKNVEKNVRMLIQELINVEVEPEDFCVRLERLLNASPQPCLIGFLKKSLPLLRQSLVTKELTIEGINPPPAEKVFNIGGVDPLTIAQNQSRTSSAVVVTTVAASPTQVVYTTQASPTTPVKVMSSYPGVTNVLRPQTIIQQKSTTRQVPPGCIYTDRQKTYSIKTATGLTPMQAAGLTRMQIPAPQQLQQQQSVVVSNASTPNRNAPGQVVVQQKTLGSLSTAKPVLQNKTSAAAALQNKSAVPSILNKSTSKEKEKKTFSSAGYTGDDDINDVAAMGGVNLAEESQRILGSTKFVGTQIRSCKDEAFVHMSALQQKINNISSSNGLEEPNQEVLLLISHAVQEKLKNYVEKLSIVAEHRIDFVKNDPRYEITQDVRGQLKFLEELDKVERKRHEEQERETLMKVAKSRTKTEDPEQAKLKAKAKEMQRAEMEEARQREANLTALQAIGPRKKPKLDSVDSGTNLATSGTGSLSAGGMMNRSLPLRPRIKRVTLRDLQFVLEQDKSTCRGLRLYKSFL